jgi:hypothetical protein
MQYTQKRKRLHHHIFQKKFFNTKYFHKPRKPAPIAATNFHDGVPSWIFYFSAAAGHHNFVAFRQNFLSGNKKFFDNIGDPKRSVLVMRTIQRVCYSISSKP